MTDWLADIEARWAAATPGAWDSLWDDLPDLDNVDTIVAAPTDVARLVAEVRALRGVLEQVAGGGAVEIWQDLQVSEAEVKRLQESEAMARALLASWTCGSDEAKGGGEG